MSESNGVRRYFNLAGVVRDLEHAASPGATEEGQDLWARFVAICDEALASALAADDGPEDYDGAHVGDDADVGDERPPSSGRNARRPGSDDAGIESLRAELARMASTLAAQQGPTRSVQGGPAALDGTGGLPEHRGKPRRTRDQRVMDEAKKAARAAKPKVKRGKTKTRTTS